MPTPDPAFAATIDSDIIRTPTPSRPDRLLSLDVLRGLTIAFMIIVNDQTGPAPFHQLSHAKWNGFTATDLVFPTFLLLVGLSTVLSTAARLARGATRRDLFLHTTRRALVLILFGVLVNNFPFFHLATARYYGVLPRIAVCYFVVATLYLISPTWRDKLALAIASLLGFWVLMRFVPIPGIGVPTHGFPINDPDLNLTAWLDRHIFSAPHLYEHTRDPEGLLSTLPALATALFGMLAGLWLRTANSTARKSAMLAAAGAISLALSLAWNPYFPINKKLWTSSFVLCAGGCSLLLLAASIYLIDHIRIARPENETTHPTLYKPLLVFGTNAILAYMISELGVGLLAALYRFTGFSFRRTVFEAIFHAIPHPGTASLLYSLVYTLICWLLVLPFYRKRIFLRI